MRYILISALAILFIISCSPEKQAARKKAKADRAIGKLVSKAKAVVNAHPDSFAADCGRLFPPLTSDTTTTIFHPGRETVITDSAQVDISSTIAALLAGATEQMKDKLIDSFLRHPIYVKVPCPPVTVRDPDTIKTTEIKVVENTAKIEAQQQAINAGKVSVMALQKDLALSQKHKGTWRLIALCFIVLFVIKKILAIWFPIVNKFL